MWFKQIYGRRLRQCTRRTVYAASAVRHGSLPGDFAEHGRISSLQQLGMREPERHGYAITPHLAASTDPRHWENPLEFDPGRYKSAPASDQVGKETAKAIGFARCPFEKASFPVKDGGGTPT